MTEFFIITVILMMLTVRSFESVNLIFNSSSIQSHQRAVVQHQCWFIGLSQAVMVSQAIAVIHSRIMEESPNSFPRHH
jgi:hypothetical protein